MKAFWILVMIGYTPINAVNLKHETKDECLAHAKQVVEEAKKANKGSSAFCVEGYNNPGDIK